MVRPWCYRWCLEYKQDEHGDNNAQQPGKFSQGKADKQRGPLAVSG